MGAPKSEQDYLRSAYGRDFNEKQHEVELTRGFYMGVCAVTHEEYETVMGKSPRWYSAQGYKAKFAGVDARRFPVDWVSWDDAKEFCRKLSAIDGKTYRLPSEAEWEYACRAGTTTTFHFGDTISMDQANYDAQIPYGNGKQGVSRGRPMPVGSFAPNAWGLYDMHGNMFQWCEDWYDEKYYDRSPKTDPMNGTKSGSGSHVMRGGSWVSWPEFARSAYRRFSNSYSAEFGFRVVLPLR
jgi:formylglycine-generating enzyme required for sulfatase activity